MRQSREVKAVSGWEDKRAKGDRMIGWRAKGRADHPWSAGGQVGTAPRAVLGAMAPRKDAMVITSLPSIQLGQHAVLTLPKAGIRVCRLVVWEDKRAKGNRRPDDWLGCLMSAANFPVSGLPLLVFLPNR